MKKDVKYFNANKSGRDFVVGDIHGCLNEFQEKLREIDFDFVHDRMFSLGDLVDRGPNSKECLDLLFEPWFHAIKGNHELLWYFAHTKGSANDLNIFISNGGTLMEDLHDIDMYSSEIKNLPFIIEIETRSGKKVGVVHAQVPPNINDWNILKNKFLESPNAEQEAMMMFGPLFESVWGRDRIDKYKRQQGKTRIYPKIENIDEVYVGHSIVDDPVTFEQLNYIDCGAFCPYWLSQTRLKKLQQNGKMLNPRLIVKELM